MGGVASAGKLVAKSVAKPFKRKAPPQAAKSVPAASVRAPAGEKGPASAEPKAAVAVAVTGTAAQSSLPRGEVGLSAATSSRGQAESKSSKTSKAEEHQVQGSKSSKSSKTRRDERPAPVLTGCETPKTLASSESVPAFGYDERGAVAETLERLPDGSNTPEQESPMKAGATPKPTTREVPEPWVKVPFEDDFYFWNTQTDETTWDIEDCFASTTPREEEAPAATAATGGPAVHWAAAALGLDSGSSEEELGQVASEMREAKAWPSGGTAPLPAVESKPEVPLPPGEWLQQEGVESEEEATAATEATPEAPVHPLEVIPGNANLALATPSLASRHADFKEVAEAEEVTPDARLPTGAPESPRAEQLAAGRLRALVAALEFYDLWKHRKSWTKVVALRAAEASPSSPSWSSQGAPIESASPGTSPKRRKNARKKEQETSPKPPKNNEVPPLPAIEAPAEPLEVLPEVLPKVEVKEVSACLRCGKGISPKRGPNEVPGRARSAVAPVLSRRKKGLPPKAAKALAKVYSGPTLPRPMKPRPA